MNTYRKKNYRGKRGYSGRPHRRAADSYHQPLPDLSQIPYARHTLTKPDVESVVDALLSGTLTQGRELERFETLLAKLTHSEFAISFSSGTAAIHGALACLKLEPEDEVITSTLNFCSIANMVNLIGAKTVLVDCDPETLTLSVEGARAAITENTKVIFTNNFGGHPSDLQLLRELCEEFNLLLLEDGSHGLGGKYRGNYVGNQADLTCFSFHPAKAITTCEGGAVTTNNRIIADRLRLFRHHGIQKDPRYFQTQEQYPDYYQELQFSGMNYRLSEIHAALGRSQLTRLDRHIERRRSIAQVYYQKLGAVEDLMLPYVADWADSAFHLYPIQLLNSLADKRDLIFSELKSAGIHVQVHYIPLHRMPLYADDYPNTDKFPNADTYFKRCLSLPLFPDLSFKDLERIMDVLLKAIEKHRPKVDEAAPAPDPNHEVEAALSEDEKPVAREPEPETPVVETEQEEPAAVEPQIPVEEAPTDTSMRFDMPDQDENIGAVKPPRKRATRAPGRPRKTARPAANEEGEEYKPMRTRRTRAKVEPASHETETVATQTPAEEAPVAKEKAEKPKTTRARATKPKTTRTTKAKATPADEAGESTDMDGKAEKKPAARVRRPRKTKEDAADAEAKPKTTRKRAPRKPKTAETPAPAKDESE